MRKKQAKNQATGLAMQAAKYPHRGTNQTPTMARAIISATPANMARLE